METTWTAKVLRRRVEIAKVRRQANSRFQEPRNFESEHEEGEKKRRREGPKNKTALIPNPPTSRSDQIRDPQERRVMGREFER